MLPLTHTHHGDTAPTRSPPQITQMFIKQYREQTGVDVRFRLSFGGSGTQARAVIDGLPADIVALALPLDVIKIAEAGLLDPDWAPKFPHQSIVVESVVSIVTRAGNPKNIRGWDDLIRCVVVGVWGREGGCRHTDPGDRCQVRGGAAAACRSRAGAVVRAPHEQTDLHTDPSTHAHTRPPIPPLPPSPFIVPT